jgi:hypothetical protein
MQKTTLPLYVIITPARNEEAFIEEVIHAVIAQTVTPVKWIIVSDGSTDRTDEIVKKYLDAYKWMQLIRMPERRERHFAAKVLCFNAGYKALSETKYDIIGNLDADITFDKDYFEFLMQKFQDNPRLGVSGTPFVELTGKSYDYRYVNQEHVSGACQLFRKACFEEIGGYTPIKGGAIDWVAVTTARMKGWKTWTFTEKTCTHHRPMGTAGTSVFRTFYKQGKKDYYTGGHPLWELVRVLYQIRKPPYLISGLLLFVGYFWAMLSRMERPISKELIRFNRSEQMKRIQKMLGHKAVKKEGIPQ